MLQRLAFGFCLLFLTSCYDRPSQDLENYKKQKNVPEFVKSLSCLKEDGYTFGSELMKRYLIPVHLEKEAEQDYYILPYSEHKQINRTRELMERRSSSEEPINDSLLMCVQQIMAVAVTKQFGNAMQYDNANIRIEQWEFKDSNVANKAYEELKRVSEYSLDGDVCLYFLRESFVYYFYVWEANKTKELKRVANKFMQEITYFNK